MMIWLGIISYFLIVAIVIHANGAKPFGYVELFLAAYWGVLVSELIRRRRASR